MFSPAENKQSEKNSQISQLKKQSIRANKQTAHGVIRYPTRKRTNRRAPSGVLKRAQTSNVGKFGREYAGQRIWSEWPDPKRPRSCWRHCPNKMERPLASAARLGCLRNWPLNSLCAGTLIPSGREWL